MNRKIKYVSIRVEGGNFSIFFNYEKRLVSYLEECYIKIDQMSDKVYYLIFFNFLLSANLS